MKTAALPRRWRQMRWLGEREREDVVPGGSSENGVRKGPSCVGRVQELMWTLGRCEIKWLARRGTATIGSRTEQGDRGAEGTSSWVHVIPFYQVVHVLGVGGNDKIISYCCFEEDFSLDLLISLKKNNGILFSWHCIFLEAAVFLYPTAHAPCWKEALCAVLGLHPSKRTLGNDTREDTPFAYFGPPTCVPCHFCVGSFSVLRGLSGQVLPTYSVLSLVEPLLFLLFSITCLTAQ